MSGQAVSATNGSRRLASWRGWLLLVIVLAVLLAMASWQWRRAAEKEALQARQDSQQNLPVLDLDAALKLSQADPRQLAGRQLVVKGRYLPGYRVALDNQMRSGVAGYELHQVLQPPGGLPAFLVNRGWLITDRDGGPAAPADDSSDALLTLHGRIVMPSDFFTAGPPEFTRGLWRAGRIEPRVWGQRWQVMLQPWVLQLAPDSPSGYRRDWPALATGEFGPERHRAYAFQWLMLAVAWVGCWTYFQKMQARSRMP